MKVIFAHDTLMTKDDKGNVYSGGSFPYSVWERYLKHFNEVRIISRHNGTIQKSDSVLINSLSLSSGPNSSFVSVPNLNSIKGKLVRKKIAKNIIRDELRKADALIARIPSEIGRLAVSIAKREGIPYLIEVVGCAYDAYYFYGNIKGKLFAPISMYQTKRVVKKSNYVIYVTKDYLQERYPTNGHHTNVSNVNIEKIDESIIKERSEKIECLNNETLLKIGMMGSLNSKYKGFDKAIKYLSEIQPNSNNYELHILGAGNKFNFEDVIDKNSMKSKVIFDGTRSSGEQVFNWLDDIDLFIQPSLTEGLPRALIEALSRGCLAIGSNRGGIPELLEDDYLFDPNDIQSFEKSIKNALATKSRMEIQMKNNVNNAEKYSSLNLSEKRDEFIRNFISKTL